jgi:hypothetical protein
MAAQRIYRRHPQAVEADVDGQRVVMSPADFGYFGLDSIGSDVWDRLTHNMTLDRLVDDLATTYTTDTATVLADVTDFLSALDAAGLLVTD